jgi:diguanylate cyclase (GGDEF)-like protein
MVELVAYRGPTWWPLARIADARTNPGVRGIAAVWLLGTGLSVLFGVLNVALNLNAIGMRLFGLTVDLTVYPPLLFSLLAAVWIGPVWGVVPVYLANVASGLWSGLGLPVSLVFALAGAIETTLIWGSMLVLEIDPDLRRRRDVTTFLAVALMAPVISSLGILIWNATLNLDLVDGQRAWRGWVIGDFLQLSLIGMPLLRCAGPAARAWVDRRFQSSPRSDVTAGRRTAVAHAILAAVIGLVFVGVWMLQRSLDIDPETRTVTGELLKPRLLEIQFFLGLLAITMLLATGAFSAVVARTSERQRMLARRDTLTGCFNRRAFYELFDREADRSRRLGQGLSLLFVDLDHFKAVNDRYGHAAGDRVLQQFAMRLLGAVRETDLLARWGGEEFLVLLSHTDPADAGALAERVRRTIAERPFPDAGGQGPVAVTVSVGTAGTTAFPIEPDVLVAAADEACRRAKAGGRNRIEHAPVIGPGPEA